MYKKLVAAVLGAVLYLVYELYLDGDFSLTDTIKVTAAGVGAFLVWLTANGPQGTVWRYAKSIGFGVTAFLATLLLTLHDGNLVGHEYVELLISLLTGAGVLIAGGAPVHDGPDTP